MSCAKSILTHERLNYTYLIQAILWHKYFDFFICKCLKTCSWLLFIIPINFFYYTTQHSECLALNYNCSTYFLIRIFLISVHYPFSLKKGGQKVKKRDADVAKNAGEVAKYAALCTLICIKHSSKYLYYAYFYHFCNDEINVENKMYYN